jgi:hypothetical protein
MRTKLFGVAALALALALLCTAGASSQPEPAEAPLLPPSAVADEAPRSRADTIKALMKSLAAVREQRAKLALEEQELLARIRKEVQAMRAEADALEEQVRVLEGPGGRKAEGKDRGKEKGPRAEEKDRGKDQK